MRIGVLGGGQLGRMLALAGAPHGHEFTFLDPAPDPCMGGVARGIRGNYDDESALAALAAASDLITFEFENVGARAIQYLQERVPVFPDRNALRMKEDRLVEKQFFAKCHIPTAPFLPAKSLEDLQRAALELGCPVIIKTRRHGYDGKGQWTMQAPGDAVRVFRETGGEPVIVEKKIPFDREISIIAVRGQGGATAFYTTGWNLHESGILSSTHVAESEATDTNGVALARTHAARILNELNYTGVLAIEFFVVNRTLLANEMAPRVHNSGHWTMDGSITSQFENHVRAIAGWPLGSTGMQSETRMFNIIGAMPDLKALAAIPGLHMHHYGKAPRAGRKMGHVNICRGNSSPQDYEARIHAAQSLIFGSRVLRS